MSEENTNSLAIQIADLLKNGVQNQTQIQNIKPNQFDSLKINLKLTSQNYPLWARMIRVAVGGKSKAFLNHLTQEPPKSSDEKYEQWEQDDLIVFSWLIQNTEPALASNLTEYPTAKTLWDALTVTYSSGKDKLQTFDLHVRANEFKQNGVPLEEFWIVMQGIWGEIERRDPNQMKCSTDIAAYNTIRSENKLFQFLNALDRKYDLIKREILRWDPLPTAEAVYAAVRKETAHQNILGATQQGVSSGVNLTGDFDGVGLVSKGRRLDKKFNLSSPRIDKSKLKCDHCGMMKHTKEQCFRLVGYPEWWADGQKKGRDGKGTEAVGSQETTSSGSGSNNHQKGTGREGRGACFMAAVEEEKEEEETVTGIGFEKNDSWIFDCGATDTMTYEISDMCSMSKPWKSRIHTANGEILQVKGGGTIQVSQDMKLSNCLYVPSLSHKLLSISHVTKELNCVVLMHPTFCILQDIRTGKIIGRGTERQGLYYVDEVVTQQGTVMLAHGSTDREAWLWHRRLGHPSTGYLHRLFPKLFPTNKVLNCETCVLAKSHRHTFKSNDTKVDFPFSLIHSDVWGPAKVGGGGQNFRYFLLFIDDCTRMTWTYLLKNKSEVFTKFTNFCAMVKTQFKSDIQILRSDNGGEFVNTSMKEFCKEKGIIHQTSCAHTPEQNGVSERKNRFLLEITRALMIESQVPKIFWSEALVTATYLVNRLPTRALSLKTPLQALSKFHKLPSTLTLEPHVFGCSVFVHIPKTERSKIDPCAEKCVFVGYGINQHGYRCYSPNKRHMFITMDCDFLETEYFYHTQHTGQGEKEYNDTLSWLKWMPSSEEINHMSLPQSIDPGNSTTNDDLPNLLSKVSNPQTQEHVDSDSPTPTLSEFSSSNIICETHENSESPESSNNETEQQSSQVEQENQTEVEPVRYELPPRTNRGVPPKRYSPEKEARRSRYPMANIAKGNISPEVQNFTTSLYSEEIPTSIEQALESRNWREEMETEMDALNKNHTWEKCILPQGKKTVGCRWVFTIKHKPDGTIDRYKARLVAKGYTQTYGIDYSETFSPVAKIDTIRVLFSIAANKGWPLHQFDVTNAFLHGELKEEVYMDLPPGFGGNSNPRLVCRLKKSLYGLKQSPRAWFGRFTLAMKKYGFKQSNSDHTLFLKRRGKLVTCLIIYVDDMIITGNDEEEMTKLRTSLFKEFEMKNLGRLKYFLGIEVLRSEQGIFICQKKYVLDLLAET